MKLRFFVLLSIMVLGSCGLADAQMISLDHADGLIDADHLDTGVPVTFYIRVQGDGDTHSGVTNGFSIASPDGATWGPMVGDTIGLGKAQFDGGFFIAPFGVTGSDADTLGFGGFRFFNTGLPVGYDDIAYTIDIGPIPESSIGKTICLDSTFYPPTGIWKWAGPDIFPDWDGPHCYTVGLPADPEIVSVAPNTAVQCDEGLVVTITGANTEWPASPVVSLTHNSGSPVITATSVVVNSATEVQATFSFAYDASTGLYDVSVGQDVMAGGFTLTAAPASNIVVTPLELSFDADECTADLGPKSFNVSSEGCAYDISISSNVAWLDLPVVDGTTPLELSTSVNSSIPGPGTHTATITITAPGALNSPQEITVTLVVPETPAPGGLEMNARILAMSASGWQDDQTVFGTGNAATDCYDAGTDQFEPPAPPGDFVRAFFRHPEWEQVSNEFNSDIRSTFSTLCKDYVLTVQTNVAENITLSLPAVVNPGCYKISLLSADGSAVLVDNFEIDDFTFMGSATHVFRVRVCAGGGGVAPSIACPTGVIDVNICGPGEVCVDLPVDNATTVTSTGNATWTDGQLCFNATASGLFVFDVTASGSCGDDVCRVEVNVVIGEEPTIVCPVGPLTAERCGLGQVCVDLDITGAETVVTNVEGATWADGQLCFAAEASGLVNFTVTATNSCGEVICDLAVNVTINDAPVIACPPDTIRVTQDAAEPMCVEIITTGADNVTLDGGDWNVSYTNNQFCYDASTLGTFSATITATNECGETTCEVVVIVSDCPLPSVECPTEPMNFEQCVLEPIQIPMAISGQNDLWVSEPNTWADGILTIVPSIFGSFHVQIRAGNDCGITECEVIVNFTQTPEVAIECPDGGFQAMLCAPEELCIDLPIANADDVVVEGGATWADGQLCFTAEPGVDYAFYVTASNACGEATCQLEYSVGSYADPLAAFTADPNEGAVPLEVTFTNTSFVHTESEEYLWDFGDGASSTEMSPMHIFETIGCFDVTLTVTDDCGRVATATETICVLDDQIVIPTPWWIDIWGTSPTIDGVPLQPGAYITAYDESGTLCGMGQVKPDGSYGMIPIYGDDPYTPEDEGATEGELITLRINGVPVATPSPLFWIQNATPPDYELELFTAEQCLTYELVNGWNLISWNVAYTGSVEEAIADIAECVDVVLSFDRGGLTYVPSLPTFSTLQSVDFYHGYWVRTNCSVILEICGGIISPNDAIQVYSGWNLVSYWSEDVLPIEDGFASLLADDNLLVAFGWDNELLDYIPGDPQQQSLDNLAPGFGYWAKVLNDDMLEYPGYSGGVIAAPRGDNQRSLAASVGVSPSRDWMSIYGANLEVDGFSVRSGASVEVYTEDGVLCGAGVYHDGILKFTPVYGFDTETSSYPKAGDQLNVRIDGERVDSDLTYSGAGARVSLGSLSAAALLPDAYSMAQNYPNPFNPSTTISFNLPTAGSVQLAIYNVLGQTVATIVDGNLEAGTHEVVWNGSDESGSAVGSGIYFYRITTSDFDQTKKMIMMK